MLNTFVAGHVIGRIYTRRQWMYRAGSNLIPSVDILVSLSFVLAGPCCFRNVLGCQDIERKAPGGWNDTK